MWEHLPQSWSLIFSFRINLSYSLLGESCFCVDAVYPLCLSLVLQFKHRLSGFLLYVQLERKVLSYEDPPDMFLKRIYFRKGFYLFSRTESKVEIIWVQGLHFEQISGPVPFLFLA